MLLHSIDNQCVTKQVFYCVAKVEKQNNFLCHKARQRIVFHLFNYIREDLDISYIMMIWLIDYVCGMVIWRFLLLFLRTTIKTKRRREIT